ncbi:MAG: STAS domain-containing protein [Acidimicrobiales bacterium]
MVAPSSDPAGPSAAETALLRTGFFLEVDDLEDSVVLRLSGELDMAAAPAVQAGLADALAGEAAAVILDLADLTFIDSTGISLFLSGSRQAADQGRAFRLRHPTGTVLRVLRIIGVDRLLDIETD